MGELTHFVYWSQRPNESPFWDEHPTALGEKGQYLIWLIAADSGVEVGGKMQGYLSQGLTHVVSRGLWWNWTEGSCIGRVEYSLTKSWNFIFCTCRDTNLERTFSTQSANRSARRSIKRGPARDNTQGAQLHMLSQKDHKLANSCLLFVMCSLIIESCPWPSQIC
jgi:hypothetical protein